MYITGERYMTPKLAVIGGSGLYAMPGLNDVQELDVDTPFGKPSAPIIVGELEGQEVAFLARHGMGHFISPSEINFRANIYALKSLGVEQIVAVSACGSLREDYAPGDIVVPDGLFDFTKGNRPPTFFEGGFVAHIGVADPFCMTFSKQVYNAVLQTGAQAHMGGDYVTIEGPRFSTQTESNTFRSWGMSIIGMTASPEAFLAREAEICYALMAHVTDYDVWHVSEEPVTVEMVIAVLNKNAEIAQQAIQKLVRNLASERTCDCVHALSTALITNPDVVPQETKEKLDLLIKKYL
jgi:5'-methylthioadenosine phosphorylase